MTDSSLKTAGSIQRVRGAVCLGSDTYTETNDWVAAADHEWAIEQLRREQSCGFAGDGPTYSCLLCGKLGTEHKSVITAERDALAARVTVLEALLLRARDSTIPHAMRFDIDAALPEQRA